MSVLASDDNPVVALLTNWLDGSWEARFLLDDQLKIIWWNRSASKWLESPHCPLKLAAQRLHAKDSRVQFKLSALISDVGVDLTSTLISNSGQTGKMLLCARQVGKVGTTTYFGLCVRSIASGHTHDLIGLADAFNLTRSEVSVLTGMVRGHTVEKIARISRTSPETIRTHVRRAYYKLNVSSREEMFSKIRPFLFAR